MRGKKKGKRKKKTRRRRMKKRGEEKEKSRREKRVLFARDGAKCFPTKKKTRVAAPFRKSLKKKNTAATGVRSSPGEKKKALGGKGGVFSKNGKEKKGKAKVSAVSNETGAFVL